MNEEADYLLGHKLHINNERNIRTKNEKKKLVNGLFGFNQSLSIMPICHIAHCESNNNNSRTRIEYDNLF